MKCERDRQGKRSKIITVTEHNPAEMKWTCYLRTADSEKREGGELCVREREKEMDAT